MPQFTSSSLYDCQTRRSRTRLAAKNATVGQACSPSVIEISKKITRNPPKVPASSQKRALAYGLLPCLSSVANSSKEQPADTKFLC